MQCSNLYHPVHSHHHERPQLSQPQQDQQQHQKYYNFLNSSLKNSNILRNTQKQYRRKLFALNFMLKNFITYRFKYDVL